MTLFSPARLAAADRLAEALGSEADLHLVGGAVRDLLLGREGGDWDFATALLPREVMARARSAGLRAIPTGLPHGTVTLQVGDQGYEVTTFRGDGDYLDGRRPQEVRLGVGLDEDLARRDFTVNAMALPAASLGREGWEAAVVDRFGGRDDLSRRLIRAVGDPLVRFAEDGLRPLRACRFGAQLGFSVEEGTFAAIRARLPVARKVAVERVLTELTKLLVGPHAASGLRLLEGSGLLDLWLPELRPLVGCPQAPPGPPDAWTRTLGMMATLPADPALRWAALLHLAGGDGKAGDSGPEAAGATTLASEVLRRLKGSGALRQAVGALIRHHATHPGEGWSDAACRRFLMRLSEDGVALFRWGALHRAEQLSTASEDVGAEAAHAALMSRLEALEAGASALTVRDLALDGAALMALAGRKGGPWLGELQRHLLEAVVEDPGLNRAAALEPLVRTWLDPAQGGGR